MAIIRRVARFVRAGQGVSLGARVAGGLLLIVASFTGPQIARAEMPIEGVWHGWVVEGKGERPDRGPVHIELKIEGNKITAKDLGTGKVEPDMGEGRYVLNLSTSPKTIDATRTSEPARGRVYLGLWSVEGDTMKWCMATPNRERPSDFETKRGQFLMILKKK